jgi:hypothetical protein
MRRSLVASVLAGLAAVALFAGTALATPGDPRVVQGAIEWPGQLSAEPFAVVRGDDGRLYYADLGSAQRRTPATLNAGSRVTVVGVEGNRPYEIAAIAIGAGDAASLGLQPTLAGPHALAPPLATAEPPELIWRLDGTVQSVAGKTVTLRTAEARTATVDASPLSESTLRVLRPGDHVSLFGVERADHRLVASGYIQREPVPPAASPRSTR